MAAKNLFMVGSTYQLMNAIILARTLHEGEDCDLILRSLTAWDEEIVKKVQEESVFGTIYRPKSTEVEENFWYITPEERMAVIKEPLLYFDEPPVQPIYDALYMGVCHVPWKLIYRYHVLNGKQPDVFLFDEGIRSYTIDLPKTDNEPYLQNEYAEAPMAKAIKALYLYQPELYSLSQYDYELRQLPNPKHYPDLCALLLRVFGYESMPKEPYIYLEDYFFVDRHITNDFSLFQQVAELVRPENIIVKRHPRDDYDRFSPMGYKTMERSVVPWETQLLANDLSSKVLISVSSTSILTPYIIFDSDIHVISLEKMLIGENPVHADEGFLVFWNKLIEKANAKETHLHTPSSADELAEVLRYIKLIQNEPRQTEGDCQNEPDDCAEQ